MVESMHILDDETDKTLKRITILLTKKEMRQLQGYVRQLLEEKPSSDHHHLSTDDYQKEITLCLYDPNNIEAFQEFIQKIIQQDE